MEHHPNFKDAQRQLQLYTDFLKARFKDGGLFDTFCIPSGELFVEFVCGGILDASYLEKHNHYPYIIRCFDPLFAVHFLQDGVEKYIGRRVVGTLYWRVLPELNARIYGDDVYRHYEYNCYTRLYIGA